MLFAKRRYECQPINPPNCFLQPNLFASHNYLLFPVNTFPIPIQAYSIEGINTQSSSSNLLMLTTQLVPLAQISTLQNQQGKEGHKYSENFVLDKQTNFSSLPNTEENKTNIQREEKKEELIEYSEEGTKGKAVFKVERKYERKGLKLRNRRIQFSIVPKGDEKIFKCGVVSCLKEFKSKENLILHFKIKHLNEKPYKCHFCEEGFTHRNGLTSHESICHEKFLHFKCTYEGCEKQFRTQTSLRYHQTIHKKGS